MKKMKYVKKQLCHLTIFFIVLNTLSCNNDNNQITLESLLDEMVSIEEASRYPDPTYVCRQESSHDRSSIAPDQPNWFANTDGFGIVRVDTTANGIEKVMFDEVGPGVITRIWITTLDKRGTWRFYFDGASTPEWTIPAYDLLQIGIPSLSEGLVQAHPNYTVDGKGGNTLYLPIPYAKGCKITFEDEVGVNPTPKYYQINYRRYKSEVNIETFSAEVVKRAESKIIVTDKLLLDPPSPKKGTILKEQRLLATADSLLLPLPSGENAVYEVEFDISIEDTTQYEQLMRELLFCAEFDNKKTVLVPLSDFSGGGMGSPYINSWYLSADGKGKVTSRWLMPYQKGGTLKLLNISAKNINIIMQANISPLKWDNRSLYFHTSWKQENGIYMHNKPEEDEKCQDWNFITIKGRGVYKGDLVSLFNHAPKWYGEGDEKIWVDDDTFPSHFGTGLEDYYNCSWAPVYPFYTPFGGAPRADLDSSHGYNAFLRTRNLDGIPFTKKFRFDIEMLGWVQGVADYATTSYWYGDYDSQAIGSSGIEQAKYKLPEAPEDPAKYKIANSIEFEEMKIFDKSPSIKAERQSTANFLDGKWSHAAQLVCVGGQVGDYIEFEFDKLENKKYKLIVYATHARDYGILSFIVNDQPTNKAFDGYDEKIKNSAPIRLGDFLSVDGKIKLKMKIEGANKQSANTKYVFGLDCIQLEPSK